MFNTIIQTPICSGSIKGFYHELIKSSRIVHPRFAGILFISITLYTTYEHNTLRAWGKSTGERDYRVGCYNHTIEEPREQPDKRLEQITRYNHTFEKYGLHLSQHGELTGAAIPPLVGKTPEFNYVVSDEPLLLSVKDKVENYFGSNQAALHAQADVKAIIDKITVSILGRPHTDYANMLFLNSEDFAQFKASSNNDDLEQGITADYDAVNIAQLGLTLMDGEKLQRGVFPLAFHEIGHSLYPPENDKYRSEMQAFYFEMLCTELFDKEMKRVGLPYDYGEHRYEGATFPSEIHQQAYRSVQVLRYYQTVNKDLVNENPRSMEKYKQYLSIIGQKS